jgi:AmpD protein
LLSRAVITADRQYQALNDSIKALKSQYLITDIVGHSDIAPGRKTEPGDTFNWSKIK